MEGLRFPHQQHWMEFSEKHSNSVEYPDYTIIAFIQVQLSLHNGLGTNLNPSVRYVRGSFDGDGDRYKRGVWEVGAGGWWEEGGLTVRI